MDGREGTDAPERAARGGTGKRRQRERRLPTAGPAPTEALLHEAALNHLARFAATEVGLVRVLQRRVARWAQRAEREGTASEAVASVVATGRAAAAAVDASKV